MFKNLYEAPQELATGGYVLESYTPLRYTLTISTILFRADN